MEQQATASRLGYFATATYHGNRSVTVSVVHHNQVVNRGDEVYDERVPLSEVAQAWADEAAREAFFRARWNLPRSQDCR
jgi:hypothetical protein